MGRYKITKEEAINEALECAARLKGERGPCDIGETVSEMVAWSNLAVALPEGN